MLILEGQPILPKTINIKEQILPPAGKYNTHKPEFDTTKA
jgi:hypothetical protein